ncbi:GTPase RsgA [Streptomyces sp. NPDC057193]|uniref:GTPase RsgA n=1 Tax=Streptomyces sp. NPDC057193 TaxID=3346043 RepID=UPI003628EF1F
MEGVLGGPRPGPHPHRLPPQPGNGPRTPRPTDRRQPAHGHPARTRRAAAAGLPPGRFRPSKSATADDGGTRSAAAELPSPRTPVLPGSVRTGEGLDTLRAHLGPGTTAVMLGPSGAGKASLLNAPEGTSETAASVGRSGGRHTTTTPACTCWPLAGPFWTPPGIRSLEGAADCLLLMTCSPTSPPSPRTAATPTAATTATWAAPARPCIESGS